jgi:hypothetical protein
MMGLSTTVQFQTPPIFKPSATEQKSLGSKSLSHTKNIFYLFLSLTHFGQSSNIPTVISALLTETVKHHIVDQRMDQLSP